LAGSEFGGEYRIVGGSPVQILVVSNTDAGIRLEACAANEPNRRTH
jgi:hypothetical protein